MICGDARRLVEQIGADFPCCLGSVDRAQKRGRDPRLILSRLLEHMISEVAIGIDLGTTYSCAAVLRQREVVIIPNDFGYRTTPSYVAFTQNDRLVGNAAKYQLSKNAKNTVYDVKRLIGCDFRDGLVQQYAKTHHWPFHLKASPDFKPLIEVEFRGQKREFRAEEISAMILAKMRDIAQVYLGTPVRDAVITVPAHFSDGQRQATKAAADIAGLRVLRIVNEPTAAAIAYGLERKDQMTHRTILVFDLGGGTCDVSILGVKGGNFTVVAQAGMADFGGESFDNRLVDYCVGDFKAKHQIDLTQAGLERPLHRLKIACETAKRHLSVATETSVDIDALHNGIDYSVSISRALFEELNCDSFARCKDILQSILDDHHISVQSLDDVVLVGGSTRIPMVQKIITDFVGKPACRTINPDEAVAYGAALLAASLCDSKDEKVAGLCFQEVTPLSLGIETAGGVFDKILDKGSPYPTQKSVLFSTYKDNQSYVRIKVYQGEHYLTRDNKLLGQFILEGIPRAGRGVPQICVVFDIDANGILSVTAQDKGSGQQKKIIMVSELGRLSQQEIAQMKDDAESYRAEDQAHNARIKAENRLEEYCYAMRHKLREQENGLLPNGLDKATVENKIVDVLQWLKSSRKSTDDKQLLETKRRELEDALRPRPVPSRITPDVCGIDLGTMNSRVAAIGKDGSTRMLPNEFENTCTASYVAFVDTMCLVGDLARRQHTFNTGNTICGIKQMIGRSSEYVHLHQPPETLPFTLKTTVDGRPLIEVVSGDVINHMVPEDILTMLLAKMRETAESNLAVPAIRAVIAVPPTYDDGQRRAVEQAAVRAGLVPIQLVDEPVAAAVAYGLDRSIQVKGELIILVFDMGSGTCDVSLLSLSNQGEFFVLATQCTEQNLCGGTFDTNLVNYCCDVYESENNINVRHDGKALRRLQCACERAKRNLSQEMLVEIDVEALKNNVDCAVTITRAGFEDLNSHVFAACIGAVKSVLQEAAFERNAVDEILLIGGCAHIPKLRKILTEFFSGKAPRKGVEPSEAIARGAAILAGRQQIGHS